jgi:hypothetical protein
MHILDYLDELPITPQAEMLRYLHHFISSYPGIQSKVMFSTPFYTGNKWMIYLSKQKNEGLELCFVQAKHFVQHKEWLDFKKRKQVAGITFHYIGDINEEVVDLLITEALRVDKLLPQAKTTQKTR